MLQLQFLAPSNLTTELLRNVSDNYFTYIAEKTKSNAKFSPKDDRLPKTNTNKSFVTPTDRNEIFYSIFSRFLRIIWSKYYTCDNFITTKK